MSESHLDLALDLLLREMELHTASLATFRQTVSTTIAVGVTVNAFLASAALQADSVPAFGELWVPIAGLTFYILIGLCLLWQRRGLVEWPDGADLAATDAGSVYDRKRTLIIDLRASLNRVQRQFAILQRGLAVLVIALVVSALAWLSILP